MSLTAAHAPDARADAPVDAQKRLSEILALAAGPSVADHVRELARKHGVTFRRTALDDYADEISRLSDAEVEPDDTADLMQALTDAGVITREHRFVLHAAYLRQRRADGAQ